VRPASRPCETGRESSFMFEPNHRACPAGGLFV
jgi:hypothetical protein